MLRVWNKSRRRKNENIIDDSDSAIDNAPCEEMTLEVTKNPRSILLDDPPEKVHVDNVVETKEAIDASKHTPGSLERSANKLKRMIVANTVLAIITIGLFILSSTLIDGLCDAPAFPSYELTSSDTDVYLEAPWWAPLSYKTQLFPVVCDKDRMRTVVEWIPFDKKKNADHHRLVIRGMEGDKMQVHSSG